MGYSMREGAGSSTDAESLGAWKAAVWERSQHRCENCGSIDRLKIRMVIPESAGGATIPSNAYVHCRTCELAAELARRSVSPASGEQTRPINFWVSRPLYDRLKTGLGAKYGFKSVASLVRYLMTKFVTDPERFDDVAQYQEQGADVKVNVWVPRDVYSRFKLLTEKNGITVTDALKGLIQMYEMEIDRVVSDRRGGTDVR